MLLWLLFFTATYFADVRQIEKNGIEVTLNQNVSIIDLLPGGGANDAVFIQEINLPQYTRVSGLSILLGTFGASHFESGTFTFTILDKDKRSVYSESFPVTDVTDNAFWRADFSTDVALKAGNYYIQVIANDFTQSIAYYAITKNDIFTSAVLDGKPSNSICMVIHGKERNVIITKYYILVVILCLITYIVFWLSIIYLKKIENIYAAVAFTLGICFMFVFPAFSYNDEVTHGMSILHYLDDFWPNGNSEESVDNIRNVESFFSTGLTYTKPTTVQYTNIMENFWVIDETNEYIIQNSDGVGLFYAYIPQMIGYSLARIFHLGAIPTIYLVQFIALCCSIAIYRLAIKISPFKKMFTILALIPVLIKVSGSLSYDCFINAMTFLLLAIIFDCIWGCRKVNLKTLLCILGLSILVLPVKIVYIAIIPILLLIPKKNLPQKLTGFWLCCIVMIITLGFVALTQANRVSSGINSPSIGPWGNTVYSYDMLLRNPSELFRLFFNSAIHNTGIQISDAVSCFCTIRMPSEIFIIIYIVVYLSVKSENILISVKEKSILTGVTILTMLLLNFVAISWTTIGNYVIMGNQGRYLQPILPIMTLLLSPKNQKKEENRNKLIFLMLNVNIIVLILLFTSIING